MLWLNEHKRIWRLIILAFLLAAMVGPWAFDRINVPAQYECLWPNFRLEGDFCGTLLVGTPAVAAGLDLISSIFARIATGATLDTNLVRNLLSFFFILTLLPVFGTLLLILAGERLRQRVFPAAMWGLVVVGCAGFLLWFSLMLGPPPIQLWGLWVYVLLAPIALILEAAVLTGKRRLG